MSSGCIRAKKERKRIIADAVKFLSEAVRILKKHPDPDKAPREIEDAVACVHKAMGPEYPNGPIRRDDGTLKYDDESDGKIGLDWLLEHYFS